MADQRATPLERVEPTAVEALTRADIDVQIATAHRYPRKVAECQKRALALATADQETAESCFYALPRTDKHGKQLRIIGPSVRLGEIIASTWHNLRVATRIIGETETHVTAQAVCHDLETNVAIAKEVRRKIVTKHGKRFTDDMVTMTAMAASSIALRNAIFAAVPKHHWETIHKAAMAMAAGDIKSRADKVTALMTWFAKRGLLEEEVLRLLNVTSIDQIGGDELIAARGMATALQDGTTTVDDLLESLKNGTPSPTEEEIEASLRKEIDDGSDKGSEELPVGQSEMGVEKRAVEGGDS